MATQAKVNVPLSHSTQREGTEGVASLREGRDCALAAVLSYSVGREERAGRVSRKEERE